MANNKKGFGVGNILDKIGDAITPKPKVESPMPVKKQPVAANPGNVANPDESMSAVQKRQRELNAIK